MATVVVGYGHGRNTWESGGGKGVRKKVNGQWVVFEEHTANVRLGEKIVQILRAHGVKVILTQPALGNDVSLNDRLAIAKKHNPDIWIELHHNAGVPSASGSCVFAWKHNSPSSNKLQKDILDNFKEAGIELHGNGEHDSTYNSWTNLFVTRNSQSLSGAVVLTENGFMTNDKDFEDIFGENKEDASTKKAIATAKGMLQYLGIEYDSGNVEVTQDWKDYEPTPEDYKIGRIGRVRIMTPALNFRKDKSLNSEVIKVLKEGETYYCYEVDGKWHNLGLGWASASSDGDLLEFVPFPPQPKEPAQKVYRVIVDGEQVGAYAEDSNILEQIKQAMPHLKEDIIIQEV